jgi:hypothetical protein
MLFVNKWSVDNFFWLKIKAIFYGHVHVANTEVSKDRDQHILFHIERVGVES